MVDVPFSARQTVAEAGHSFSFSIAPYGIIDYHPAPASIHLPILFILIHYANSFIVFDPNLITADVYIIRSS